MHRLIFRLFVVASIVYMSEEHTTVDYDHQDYSRESNAQTAVGYDHSHVPKEQTTVDYVDHSRVSREQTTVGYDYGDHSRVSREQTTVDYDYGDHSRVSREQTTVGYDYGDHSRVSREQTTVNYNHGDYSRVPKDQTTVNYNHGDYSHVPNEQTTVDYYHGDYSNVSKEQTTVDYDYNDYYYPDNYYDEDDSITYDDYSVLNGSGCAYFKHSCKWLYQDCKCDVNCDIFKDCCSDANASNAYTTPEMTEKLREVAPFIRCDYVPEVYNRWFIFVVNSCPNDADKIVQYLCQNIDSENIISRTPVVGNVSRLLYRNLYCAVCNNEPYTLLNPQLSCSWETPYEGNHTIEELVKMEECTVKYFSTNFYEFATKTLRSCYHTVSECSDLSADDIHQEECKSGRNEYVLLRTTSTSTKVATIVVRKMVSVLHVI